MTCEPLGCTSGKKKFHAVIPRGIHPGDVVVLQGHLSQRGPPRHGQIGPPNWTAVATEIESMYEGMYACMQVYACIGMQIARLA